MIIYIAGFQSIPDDVLEAAEIDGANWWQKLTGVTIPMMMSSITICMFLSITNGFKLFDQTSRSPQANPRSSRSSWRSTSTTRSMAAQAGRA